VSPDRQSQIRAVATCIVVLFVLALAPTAVSAQSLNGSIYAVEGASRGEAFAFSVSGGTFVAFLIGFGPNGHGAWFVAAGTTDGVSGTGQLFSPLGFALPSVGTMQFQLDAPGAPTGHFATTGLESAQNVLNFQTSGRLVRIFP
jgi:hypothetical protein